MIVYNLFGYVVTVSVELLFLLDVCDFHRAANGRTQWLWFSVLFGRIGFGCKNAPLFSFGGLAFVFASFFITQAVPTPST